MTRIKIPIFIAGGIVIVFYIVFYAIGLYIKIQEHNLNVISEIGMCAKVFDGEEAEDCAEAVKRTYIPYYKTIE